MYVRIGDRVEGSCGTKGVVSFLDKKGLVWVQPYKAAAFTDGKVHKCIGKPKSIKKMIKRSAKDDNHDNLRNGRKRIPKSTSRIQHSNKS